MCFPLASQIEGVANSTPDARSQRGRVPEPEFDGLLLAARTRGAVRVRPKPRLTLDAHFRAVADMERRLASGASRISCFRWSGELDGCVVGWVGGGPACCARRE